MYFTYLFGWSKTEKYYYGVRYKDGCGPETLGVTYFSSSRYVKEYIKEHGIPDIIEVRKTFETKQEAKDWETKVLIRLNAGGNPKWLNRGNNGSFRNCVMDEQTRKAISRANKGRKNGKSYTNGVRNLILKDGQEIPEGFVLGYTRSQKFLEAIKNRRELTPEEKKIAAEKKSKSLKGKKKPDGFAEKISKHHRGRPKEWARGDNNVSKRPEVRKKISEKLSGRNFFRKGDHWIFVVPGEEPEGYVQDSPINGRMIIHNPETREMRFVSKTEEVPSGWVKGSLPRKRNDGVYYNNGKNSKMFYPDDEIPDGWVKGRLTIQGGIKYNDGKNNKMFYPGDEIPDGWVKGQVPKSGATKYNNGLITKIFCDGEEIPEGWVKGMLPRKRKCTTETKT